MDWRLSNTQGEIDMGPKCNYIKKQIEAQVSIHQSSNSTNWPYCTFVHSEGFRIIVMGQWVVIVIQVLW